MKVLRNTIYPSEDCLLCKMWIPIIIYKKMENNADVTTWLANQRAHRSSGQDKRIIHISFNHGGINISPGRKRLFARVLHNIWGKLGEVQDAYYQEQFLFGVIAFSSLEDTKKAFTTLNNSITFNAILNESIVALSESDDRFLVDMIVKELFVEHEGRFVSAIMFPSGARFLKANSVLSGIIN